MMTLIAATTTSAAIAPPHQFPAACPHVATGDEALAKQVRLIRVARNRVKPLDHRRPCEPAQAAGTARGSRASPPPCLATVPLPLEHMEVVHVEQSAIDEYRDAQPKRSSAPPQ